MDEWMVVPARLTDNDRRFLKDLAEAIAMTFGDPIIVNIGIWQGGSMYCLRAGAPGAFLVGVDIRGGSAELGNVLQARIIKGDSCRCADKVTAPVHLLFVDGDHHYDAVKCDIDKWVPKIPVGGVVVFHDYCPPATSLEKPALHHLAEVRLAVDEWQTGAGWEIIYGLDSMIAFRRPAP